MVKLLEKLRFLIIKRTHNLHKSTKAQKIMWLQEKPRKMITNQNIVAIINIITVYIVTAEIVTKLLTLLLNFIQYKYFQPFLLIVWASQIYLYEVPL